MEVHASPVEDFAALGAVWRALEAELGGVGFFQSWSWIGCLAQERYPDAVLLRAEAAGRTLGLALFNRRQGRLCLAESGDPGLDAPFIEHNAPLGTTAATDAILQAAWRVPRMRRLVLNGVAPRIAMVAGGATWRMQERSAPFVDLAAVRQAGGDHLAACSANTRQQIRRSARLYEARGALRLRAAADGEEAISFFDALVALHEQNWHARGKPGAFATPFLQRFHRAMIRDALPRGEVEMLRVTAGDDDVGYLYNFRLNGRVHAYQSGLDRVGADRHGKPGLTCHVMAIHRALSAGDAVYDFMGGDDRYKLSLANDAARLVWAELVRPWSLPGMAARLRRALS